MTAHTMRAYGSQLPPPSRILHGTINLRCFCPPCKCGTFRRVACYLQSSSTAPGTRAVRKLQRVHAAANDFTEFTVEEVVSGTMLPSSIQSDISRLGVTNMSVMCTVSEVASDEFGYMRVSDLLRFTLPTLGIWLIGPILSLVDTAFVGAAVRSTSPLVLIQNAPHVHPYYSVHMCAGLRSPRWSWLPWRRGQCCAITLCMYAHFWPLQACLLLTTAPVETPLPCCDMLPPLAAFYQPA